MFIVRSESGRRSLQRGMIQTSCTARPSSTRAAWTSPRKPHSATLTPRYHRTSRSQLPHSQPYTSADSGISGERVDAASSEWKSVRRSAFAVMIPSRGNSTRAPESNSRPKFRYQPSQRFARHRTTLTLNASVPNIGLPALLDSEANPHGLDTQLHQKQQIIVRDDGLHMRSDRIRQRIPLKTLVLDRGPEHVEEAADVVCLPVEDGRPGDGLTVSHVEHRVGGQLARRLFEIDQPAVVKAVGQEGVHVAVDQVADEYLRGTVRLESPHAVVRRFARAQIGHREHRVSDGDSLAAVDNPSRKPASRRPLVAKHRPENLLLRRVVTTNHIVHAGDGVYGDIRIAQQWSHTAVVIRMSVGDDDRCERLPQRLDARAKGFSIRDTERRVDDDDARARLDEVGIHRKKAGFETVNRDRAVGCHESERTIDTRRRK